MPSDTTKSGEPRKREAREGEGRPSKYDPKFCDELVDCARRGHSLTGFAGKIGVARSTIDLWAAEFPEFLEALTCARSMAAFAWEERAINVGDGGGGPGSSQIIQFALRNMAREDWNDKPSSDEDDSAPTQRVEIAIVDARKQD